VEKWDTAIKEELDGNGHHQVYADLVETGKGRTAVPMYLVYHTRCHSSGDVQMFRASLVCAGIHHIECMDH